MFRDNYIRLVMRWRFALLAVFALITVLFGTLLPKLEKDNSLQSMFPENDPAILANTDVADWFNLKDRVIVQVFAEGGILNSASLGTVAAIESFLSSHSRIESVKSLTTFKDIRSDAGALSQMTPYEEYLDLLGEGDRDQAHRLLTRAVEEYPLLENILISRDRKSAFVYAQPDYDLANDNASSELYDDLSTFVEGLNGSETVRISGFPVVVPLMSKSMSQDMRKMLPLVVLVLAVVLFACFRDLVGVVLPLLEVSFALIWTFGLMAACGLKISIVGLAMPVLLLSIGIADDIYFLLEYRRELALGCGRQEAVTNTLRSLFIPHLLTSATTAIGFLSFAFSDLSALRHFGLFTAFGVFSTLLFSLFIIPALVTLLPAPNIRSTSSPLSEQETVQPLLLAVVFRMVKSRWTPACILLLFGVCMLAASGVEVRHSAIEFFPENSTIRQADALMNTQGGGTTQLNIVFTADKELADSGLFHLIERLQDELAVMEEVGVTVSAVDYVKHMNFVYNERRPDLRVLPENDDAIRQLLLLYDLTDPEILENLATPDLHKLNLIILMRKNHTVAFQKVKDAVAGFLAENMTEEQQRTVAVSVAGFANINIAMINHIITTQKESISLALIAIFVMLLVVYRNVVRALITVLPVAFSVFAMFGLMALLDIPINLVTCLISGIVAGIGIDYAVHLVTRLQNELKNEVVCRRRIAEILDSCGSAILFNALSLSLGFAVLLVSEFLPLRYLGGLLAVAMLLSAGVVVLFIPALLLRRLSLPENGLPMQTMGGAEPAIRPESSQPQIL